MHVLAVTQFGSLVGLPSVLLCLALISFLLFSPLPRGGSHVRVAISWFFVYVCFAFAAMWFWLNLALPLGAWMFVLGDRNSWFYDYASLIAGTIAILVSCLAFARGMSGAISWRYIQVLKWVPPILLIAAGAVFAEEMFSRMAGVTAESAAQNMIERFHKYNASIHLVAHTGPALFPDQPPDQRTFWIVDGQEKIGLIMVWRNGILGWKLLRSHWFGDPKDILMDAQVYLDLGDQVKARYCLEQVIRNLPGTPAEKEARRLLRVKLGGSVAASESSTTSPAPISKPSSVPETLWTFEFKERPSLAAAWHVGDTVFATVRDGSTLLAVNDVTGELRYRTALVPKGAWVTPCFVGQSPNKSLEFSTLHKVIEIDPATGVSQHSYDVPHRPDIPPLQVGNDYLAISPVPNNDANRLLRQGGSVWKSRLPGNMVLHHAVLGNLAVIQTRGQSYGGQRTVCLDLATGRSFGMKKQTPMAKASPS